MHMKMWRHQKSLALREIGVDKGFEVQELLFLDISINIDYEFGVICLR